MNFLLTALSLGVVSMIVVLVSGFSSGVVRLTTLGLRSVFAFAMTSAAVYFLLMLYDYYEEKQAKKFKKEVAETVAEEPPPAESAEEQTPPEVAFQPINAADLPNVEK